MLRLVSCIDIIKNFMTLRCQNKLSRAIRKPAVCLDVKTKAQISCTTVTAQSISAFVSALFFIYFTFPLLPKSEILSLAECSARVVSDMIGNPEDRFSNDAAQLIRIELCTTFLFGVESFVILCYSNGFITIFDEEKIMEKYLDLSRKI